MCSAFFPKTNIKGRGCETIFSRLTFLCQMAESLGDRRRLLLWQRPAVAWSERRTSECTSSSPDSRTCNSDLKKVKSLLSRFWRSSSLSCWVLLMAIKSQTRKNKELSTCVTRQNSFRRNQCTFGLSCSTSGHDSGKSCFRKQRSPQKEINLPI